MEDGGGARVEAGMRTCFVSEASYLAAIVESSNDAVIGKDLDGVVRSWNPAAELIFGYKANEILGRHISILFPEDRLAEEDMILGRIKRGERVRHYETVRRTKDGREIPVSLTVSPIVDVAGRVVGASKILRDISDRVAAERTLARSEAEFRASFEGAAVGKALADPQSRRILRVNSALARMLGYEPDAMIGMGPTEITWPDDLGLDDSDYARLLAGGQDSYVCEKRYWRRDRQPLWVRVSATLARVPESDHPVLVVIAVEDIDSRRMAQTALEAATVELEQALAERTAALSQRNLLLREVYHRVKNNLQIIDSLVMMQARKLTDPEGKQALLDLLDRIYALGSVHTQLMASPDLRTFDLGAYLRELSDNLHEGSAQDGIRLSVDAHPLRVGLDFAVPMGLIVTELVTNALKHAFPDGHGHIAVCMAPVGDKEVSLIVKDDGRRHPPGRAASPARAGLGTHIVRNYVAQLGGTMTTEAEAGTTIEIRVPLPVSP